MVLQSPREPLVPSEVPMPALHSGQLRIRVTACAVCRTDLHLIDGELPNPKLPLIPGHEIVGRIEKVDETVEGFRVGERVGIPWLGWACGECKFCRTDRENLCRNARFTGYTLDGGYAEYTMVDARFCFRIPDAYDDISAAPLLCAGLIGYRSLRKAGDAERLGIYGFGAAAHIVAQVAHHQGRKVFAFTRPGDRTAQQFALSLGADWAGGSDERAPRETRCRNCFRPNRRACAHRAPWIGTRRHRRLRRYSYERYSKLPLHRSLAGTPYLLGRKPNEARRLGLPQDRTPRPGDD